VSRQSDLPPPVWVADDGALQRLVRHVAGQGEVALDTEANSMFAYRERLCLLQLSTRKQDFLVDPLAGIDLALLAPVLADPGLVKVLHSAEFDVLLLKRTRPFEVRGLFDTRVAAASLGMPSPSLAAVLDRWSNVHIDKSPQRSDWGQRPLTARQLDYARADTHHLLGLAHTLRQELYEAGPPHMEEVAAECRRLETLTPDEGGPDPDDWLRIRGAAAIDGVGRRVLRDLGELRHEIARRLDQPLFRVLPNDGLLAVARAMPQSLQELGRSNALSDRLVERYGSRIVDVVRRALTRGPLRREHAPATSPEDRLQRPQREAFERLRRWRKATAERRATDPALILDRHRMLALCRTDPLPDDVADLRRTGLLESWRVEHYGADIARALAGR
jgi:ribonuclease D